MVAMELASECENPQEMVELFQVEFEAAFRMLEIPEFGGAAKHSPNQHATDVESVLNPSLSASLLAGGTAPTSMHQSENRDLSGAILNSQSSANYHAAECVGRELLRCVQNNLGIQVQPFQCPVCLDDVTPPLPTAALVRSVSEFRLGSQNAGNDRFLAAVCLQQCRHPVCLACFTRAVDISMRDKVIAHCPCAPRCGDRIVELDVSRFIGLEAGNQYALIEQRDIAMHPPISAIERVNSRQFHCPTPNCPSSIIIDTRARDYGAKWTCPACRVAHCVRCELPWHKGSTCAAHQQWRRENGHAEDEMQRLVRERNFKTCRCGALVERLSGCSKLTCLCGARLCDQCGTIFDKSGDRCAHTNYDG
jgi:hypothetical protein